MRILHQTCTYELRRVWLFNVELRSIRYVEYSIHLRPELLRILASVETGCELLRITVPHCRRTVLLQRTKRFTSEHQSCKKGRLKRHAKNQVVHHRGTRGLQRLAYESRLYTQCTTPGIVLLWWKARQNGRENRWCGYGGF